MILEVVREDAPEVIEDQEVGQEGEGLEESPVNGEIKEGEDGDDGEEDDEGAADFPGAIPEAVSDGEFGEAE